MKLVREIIKKAISFAGQKSSFINKNEGMLVQFLCFCFVGFTNMIVAYITYLIALYFFHYIFTYDYIVANIVSFFVSSSWSFFWNNNYVFEKGNNKVSMKKIICMLMKNYCVYGFSGIVLSNVLSFVWIEILLISKYVAPVINIVISVPINYVLNKYWVYRLD